MGGAIGDCLGANTEFKSLDEIKELYGNSGLTDFIGKDDKGYITDDTQMTLFTIEAILNYEKDLSVDKSLTYEFMKSYKNWYITQYNKYNEQVSKTYKSDLMLVEDMYRWRAPGNTCLTSIKQMDLVNKEYRTVNDSKGCGAIMRIAPIGLTYLWNSHKNGIDNLIKYTIENVLLTHQHILSTLSCLYYIYIINRLTESDTFMKAKKDMKLIELDIIFSPNGLESKFLHNLFLYNYKEQDTENSFSTIKNLWQTVKDLIYSKNSPSIDDIKQIGQGWVAEETLMIALYCVIQAKSFEECIILAANHDGDTGSTAALAGQLYGLINPNEVINSKFFNRINEKDLILDYSNKLFNVMVNKNGLY